MKHLEGDIANLVLLALRNELENQKKGVVGYLMQCDKEEVPHVQGRIKAVQAIEDFLDREIKRLTRNFMED